MNPVRATSFPSNFSRYSGKSGRNVGPSFVALRTSQGVRFTPSGRIFVSYRREETAYPAAWLYDRLAERFGAGQVFKDVDSIQLGDDFVEVITRAVGSCDVLLALMLSGGLDFSAEFSASGADAASLRQSLSGSGQLHLKNGAIEGAQGLADLLAKAGVARSGLSFDLVTVQFRFEDGRVYNDDIQVDGKELDLGLKGWTSFDGRMEYSFDGASLLALLPKDARERVTAALGPDGKIPGTLARTWSVPWPYQPASRDTITSSPRAARSRSIVARSPCRS